MNKAKAESLILGKNEALRNQQQMINEASGMADSSFTELELKKKQMKLYEEQIIPADEEFSNHVIRLRTNTEELFSFSMPGKH
ncbi:MAG: hypothetical protein IPL84_18025 [Chitinophagaceae bacterium]|nr:hypothetical protein [Chitinophagaceae bacterium]